MLVVSDASAFNVLVRIDKTDVLVQLFGRIIVPPAVVRELSDSQTPEVVRQFMAAPPPWLEIRSPKAPLPNLQLGDGEREAIPLAIELNADILLVDDLKARREARRLGVTITGAIGVLELAAARGILELRVAFQELRSRAPDFRAADTLLNEALERDAARRGQSMDLDAPDQRQS